MFTHTLNNNKHTYTHPTVWTQHTNTPLSQHTPKQYLKKWINSVWEFRSDQVSIDLHAQESPYMLHPSDQDSTDLHAQESPYMLHPSDQVSVDLHAQESPCMLHPQALKIPHAAFAPQPRPPTKNKNQKCSRTTTHMSWTTKWHTCCRCGPHLAGKTKWIPVRCPTLFSLPRWSQIWGWSGQTPVPLHWTWLRHSSILAGNKTHVPVLASMYILSRRIQTKWQKWIPELLKCKLGNVTSWTFSFYNTNQKHNDGIIIL